MGRVGFTMVAAVLLRDLENLPNVRIYMSTELVYQKILYIDQFLKNQLGSFHIKRISLLNVSRREIVL